MSFLSDFLSLLYVACQVEGLREHESNGQSHQAKQLEVDPDVFRKVVGNIQIGNAREKEEQDPCVVQAGPDGIG